MGGTCPPPHSPPLLSCRQLAQMTHLCHRLADGAHTCVQRAAHTCTHRLCLVFTLSAAKGSQTPAATALCYNQWEPLKPVCSSFGGDMSSASHSFQAVPSVITFCCLESWTPLKNSQNAPLFSLLTDWELHNAPSLHYLTYSCWSLLQHSRRQRIHPAGQQSIIGHTHSFILTIRPFRV